MKQHIRTFKLLFNTIRYLRPVQVYSRILHRFTPRPSTAIPPVSIHSHKGTWIPAIAKQDSYCCQNRFRFLNHEITLEFPHQWNDTSLDKLWLYNLHYFDFINSPGLLNDPAQAAVLVDTWVAQNPPFKGIGWDPYPVSLRIVNWIKWVLAGNVLSPDALNGLYLQARWLHSRIEYHLLANHLFTNAKALVFAGLFFNGDDAEMWLNKGMGILIKEIPEQILEDGGNFELSPMYHSIMLEDLLDLENMVRHEGDINEKYNPVIAAWQGKIPLMFRWLSAMSHSTDTFVLFNDAAFNIAPAFSDLLAYAQRLGLYIEIPAFSGVTDLTNSGYVRLQKGASVCILDAAPVGPSYQPGHAHADTLTFELSLDGKPVIVDSGTSCYGCGAERLRQRSTQAHNTVVVDNRDSSEVWSGFRVACRATVIGRSVSDSNSAAKVIASHNGYTRLKSVGVHERSWTFEEKKLFVDDTIKGIGRHRISITYHIHPDYQAVRRGENQLEIVDRNGKIIMTFAGETGLAGEIQQTSFHPEFGVSLQNHTILFSGEISLPFTFKTSIAIL